MKQGLKAKSVTECVTRNGRVLPLAPNLLKKAVQKRRYQDRGTPPRPRSVLSSLPPDQLLSRKEMCGYVRRSIACAEKWAANGTGPKITECWGRGGVVPFYRVKDVTAFLAEYNK